MTPGQSGSGNNGNKDEHHFPQSTRSGAPPLYVFGSLTKESLGRS